MLLKRLNHLTVSRYSPWLLCIVLFAVSLWGGLSCNGVCAPQGQGMDLIWSFLSIWAVTAVFGFLSFLGVYDLLQNNHAITRNYPVIGHLRFLLEEISPEIRQYFIEDDKKELPFSRMQRSLVYKRAKDVNSAHPFGTEENVYQDAYEWLNHSMQPTHLRSHDFRITVGKERAQPYEASIFNISAMSFGSLSANAIMALNAGAQKGGFAHDTGEGSVSKYHLKHGGDLILQIGSGYYGFRTEAGGFDPEKFATVAKQDSVKMIEIKLSQGAKPGHGGMLPARKITAEIAEARGIPIGQDCISPSAHSTFSTPIELMQFIQQLRELSGDKPVGIKLCIGHQWEWFATVKAMLKTDIVPDFIVVDGSEGGTGAAPIEFSDHLGMPINEGLLLVHNTLVGVKLRHRVKVACAGKIISGFDIMRMMAFGADWCNAARGFMFSIGCIQAQSCHTGECPTGVATQNKRRQRGLVVTDKAERVYNYHLNTLKAVKELTEAAGLEHPNEVTTRHIMRRMNSNKVRALSTVINEVPYGALLEEELSADLPISMQNYWHTVTAESFTVSYCPVRLKA